MFYEPKDGHGLPHDPLQSCVLPRPIAWISSLSREGVVNLAPYSYFNLVCRFPPMLMFSSNGRLDAKDTLRNCEDTGEFVVNVATFDNRQKIAATGASMPREVDEMAAVGLTPAASSVVAAPGVAESPIRMECKTHQVVELPCEDPAYRNAMVVGTVVGVHIDDEILREGLIDLDKLRPLGRLGYFDYCSVDNAFQIPWKKS